MLGQTIVAAGGAVDLFTAGTQDQFLEFCRAGVADVFVNRHGVFLNVPRSFCRDAPQKNAAAFDQFFFFGRPVAHAEGVRDYAGAGLQLL